MTKIEFLLYCNFFIIFFIYFMYIFILSGKNLPKKINRQLIIAVTSTLILTIIDILEAYYRYFTDFHYIRVITCTLGYIIRPLCAGIFLLIMNDYNKKLHQTVFIVLSINTIISGLNLFIPTVFKISEDNTFSRSYLWPIPFIASFGLMILMVILVSLKYNLHRRKAVFTYAAFLSVSIGAISETFGLTSFTTASSGITSIFFLYLYLNTDLYKKDALTKLYDRRTFDQDIKKYSHHNMIIAAMDLNDLKYWNDTFGHSEGDLAITTSTDAMKTYFQSIGNIYRTGGDEFMCIFPKAKIKDIQSNIDDFKNYMFSTKYRIAFGCAEFHKNDNLEEILTLADQRMYENKKFLKESKQ